MGRKWKGLYIEDDAAEDQRRIYEEKRVGGGNRFGVSTWKASKEKEGAGQREIAVCQNQEVRGK